MVGCVPITPTLHHSSDDGDKWPLEPLLAELSSEDDESLSLLPKLSRL